jgi:hypothetical protein
MASNPTGYKSPATRGGWRKGLWSDSLPLAVAFQGLGLFVLAFLLGVPSSTDQVEENATGFAAFMHSLTVPTASNSRVPTDLLPEQIRLPRFPNLDDPAPKRQPAPNHQDMQEASNPGVSLAALRVDSVAFDAPEAVQVALAFPDAPELLTPGSISPASFGSGQGSPGRKGREGGGGWGGVGISGGGRGRGGACGRGGSGSGTIVERGIRYQVN